MLGFVGSSYISGHLKTASGRVMGPRNGADKLDHNDSDRDALDCCAMILCQLSLFARVA
jgi:hypothetical protein